MQANHLRNASYFLLAALFGFLGFWAIAGLEFLDPTNVAWLKGGDPLQHYLGWAFYRSSPWTWPIGLNPMYGMSFSNSIVFTDSIPLLAIPFKLFAQYLPHPFQYQGIWVLLCFIFQAVMAFRLINLVTSKLIIQYLGVILFIFSPPLIFRLNLHESLMGHFLILAALYLNLKSYSSNNSFQRAFSWILLLSMAAMIHFYLFIMIVPLWFADLVSRVVTQKRCSLIDVIFEGGALVTIVGFLVWQAGYFALGQASAGSGGFGDFRTNLLALFNSRSWSYLIRPIPLRDPVEAATGEGFQYLGLGPIFLILFIAFALVKKKFKVDLKIKKFCKKNFFLILTLLILTLLSFSNNLGFGPWNVRIVLPEFLVGPLSIIRSSSRLFWPLFYSILLGILYCVVRLYSPKNAILLIGIAAFMQVVDTSAGWLKTREKLTIPSSKNFNSQLKNPFWSEAGRHYKNVVTNDVYGVWEDFGIYASQNRMNTSITYLARVSGEKVSNFFESINQQIYKTNLDPQSLYILRDWKNASDKASYQYIKYNPNSDLLARIDGFNVLAPGWKACNACAQVQGDLELKQLSPILKLNQVVDFKKSGDGRSLFMLNGWGYTEDWGTWAIQPSASIVLPMPEGGPSRILIRANAFLTPSHSNQVVYLVVNGVRMEDPLVLTRQQGNLLEVNLPPGQMKPGEPVNIEFLSQDSISPQDAGLSSDDRKLGIGLVSIQFMH